MFAVKVLFKMGRGPSGLGVLINGMEVEPPYQPPTVEKIAWVQSRDEANCLITSQSPFF